MANGPKKTAAATVAPTTDDAIEAAIAPVAAVAEETARVMELPAKALDEKPLQEIQGNLRSVVEKSLIETRNVYAQAKSNADEAASAIESSYAAAKAGVVAINTRALEALRANVEANFEFMRSAIAVKTVADYMTLQGEFARRQFDAVTGQTKEISELARKVAVETTEPIKLQVAKSFRISA